MVLGVSLNMPAAIGADPTYHRDVAPVLQKHCQECHRPNQVAPFSLLTYEQARKRAGDLSVVVDEKRMPPWHASTSEGGPFKEARVLSDAEKATLEDWIAAGCPEGSPLEAPRAREFASNWSLGEPDLILKVAEPFTLGAEGRDEIRVFVLATGLKEGRWVSSVDFQPGNRKVVHHILAAFDKTGEGRKRDESDPSPGYASFAGFGIPGGALVPAMAQGRFGGLSGWAPGKAARPLPAGVGRYIPAGADVLLQVHYHRSGKVEKDASAIGLYFAQANIDKQVRGAAVMPPRPRAFSRPTLNIPAGDPNYEVTGTLKLAYDAHLIAVVPHMHWLGKDFRLTATRPDGVHVPLIRVDRWDFNWQDTYEFVAPVGLPTGTRIDMVAHFDNSAGNPSNPNHPPINVSWGEQTSNEMCIGFLQLTRDEERLANRPPAGLSLPLQFDAAPTGAKDKD
jgi:hypothetical protein